MYTCSRVYMKLLYTYTIIQYTVVNTYIVYKDALDATALEIVRFGGTFSLRIQYFLGVRISQALMQKS